MINIFRWMYEHKCTIGDLNQAISDLEYDDSNVLAIQLLKFIKWSLTEHECE